MKDKQSIVVKCKDFLVSKSEVKFAYVFGSFIKSEMPRDLDIAIYLGERKINTLKYVLKIGQELSRVLLPLGVTPDVKVLNNAPLYFHYEVIKEGKPILVRNQKERIEYEAKIIIEYLDFLPLLREYNKLMRDKIRSW